MLKSFLELRDSAVIQIVLETERLVPFISDESHRNEISFRDCEVQVLDLAENRMLSEWEHNL